MVRVLKYTNMVFFLLECYVATDSYLSTFRAQTVGPVFKGQVIQRESWNF